METEKIIEGNRLIALFMGASWVNNKVGVTDWHGDIHALREAEYHSSWDWLMPVVEKIEQLKYSIKIESYKSDDHEVCIWEDGDDAPIVNEYSETKIDCIYKAAVQFIIRYSNNSLK